MLSSWKQIAWSPTLLASTLALLTIQLTFAKSKAFSKRIYKVDSVRKGASGFHHPLKYKAHELLKQLHHCFARHQRVLRSLKDEAHVQYRSYLVENSFMLAMNLAIIMYFSVETSPKEQ